MIQILMYDTRQLCLYPSSVVSLLLTALTLSCQAPFNTVSYSIVDGSDKFAISSSGKVTLKQTIPEGRYTVRIRASDGGTPSKSTDTTLTVIVGSTPDTGECPIFASGSRSRTVAISETRSPQVSVAMIPCDVSK